MVGEAVRLHGPSVAAAPERGNGAASAVDVGDAPVAECGQVLDGQGDALVVGGPDDVDLRRRDGPADGHYGQLAVQGGELLGRGLRADQDQGLAPGVQQRLDRPRLVAAPG